MKKLKLIGMLLGISVIITACGNNNQDEIPQEKLRPIEIEKLRPIEMDKEYDLSEYVNKNVFVIYRNDSEEDLNVIISQNTTAATNIKMNENKMQSSGNYYNIPYNPPEFHFEKIIAASTSSYINRNMQKSESAPAIGDKRDFYGFDSNDLVVDNLAKDAVLKVIGDHCNVWYVTKDGINVTDDMLHTLASTFDSIFEKETYLFGSNIPTIEYDNIISIDESTKIDIIVYDIFGDVETTKANNGGTYGYFASLDFRNQDLEENGITYKSNNSQCLHIDSYFLEVVPDAQRSTIAHEFQHLLHYVNKNLNCPLFDQNNQFTGNQESETWFNEMMSMVCEDIMQSQLGIEDKDSPKSRLSLFNSIYNLGFTTWRNGEDVYFSYANAYAFGAYLLRNYGINFIKELAHNKYVNQEAITEALKTVNAKETSFEQVYNNFYNVILYPEASDKPTLNKAVTQTYNDVIFECSAINLSEYITINGEYMTEDAYQNFYQGAKLEDYYGPKIWDNYYYFNKLGPNGFGVSHIKVRSDKPIFTWSSKAYNSNLKYYFVIED